MLYPQRAHEGVLHIEIKSTDQEPEKSLCSTRMWILDRSSVADLNRNIYLYIKAPHNAFILYTMAGTRQT